MSVISCKKSGVNIKKSKIACKISQKSAQKLLKLPTTDLPKKPAHRNRWAVQDRVVELPTAHCPKTAQWAGQVPTPGSN